MQIVLAPLKLSMAGIRLTGYMIENNMRVAQAFGQAAIQVNPFMSHAPIASVVNASKPVAKAKRAAPVRAKPAPVAKPAQPEKAPVVAKKAVAANTGAKPRAKPVVKAPVKAASKTAAPVAVKPAEAPATKAKSTPKAAKPAPNSCCPGQGTCEGGETRAQTRRADQGGADQTRSIDAAGSGGTQVKAPTAGPASDAAIWQGGAHRTCQVRRENAGLQSLQPCHSK